MPNQVKKEADKTPDHKRPVGGAGRQPPVIKKEDGQAQNPKGPQSEPGKRPQALKTEEGRTQNSKGPQSELGRKPQLLKNPQLPKMPTPAHSEQGSGRKLPAPETEKDKMPTSASSDDGGTRQLPALARMTPEVRGELLNILRKTDRALCLQCLKDYRDHPERICTFRAGSQRCEGCAYKGVYCLKLLVNEKRPCFRVAQKLACEITEHRIEKEGEPISRQVMEAYDTALDAALSFADAVKDIKDLKEDRDRIAATTVRLLQLGDDCDSEEEALQWANKCGWELANLKRDDLAAAARGGFVPGADLDRSENLIKAFVDLREITSKRWQLEDNNIRITKQLAEAKDEIGELKHGKKRAEDARDNVVSELGNSKAAILVAETALERSKLELETMRVTNTVALRSPFPLGRQHANPYQRSLALSTRDATKANALGPSDLHRLPGSVKALLFKYIFMGLPSLSKSVSQRPAATAGVNRAASELYYLGKSMDFRSGAAMLHYLYNNNLSMQLPGIKYQWSRGDHSHVLNLSLSCREVMIRVIHTQALFHKGAVSASNTMV
ncbi:hypothetical protein RB595_009456 [Gaeumannomyces hyphopodioides]